MAGAEYGEDEEVRDAAVEDPFEQMARLLAAHGGAMTRIYDELAGVGYDTVGPYLAAAALVANPIDRAASHTKLRVREVIISTDTAATVTLTIGAATYPFVMAAGGLFRVIPFPLVIDRAGDVSFVSSLAATMACYLIARPE